MSISTIVVCPRCGKRHHVHLGQAEVECDCHLYCDMGSKPSDCSLTKQNYTGKLGYPTGVHTDSSNGGDDVLHRVYYCSTHGHYTYKQAVQIEVTPTMFSGRLPKKHRLMVRT